MSKGKGRGNPPFHFPGKCNACQYAEYKWRLGDRFLEQVHEDGSVSISMLKSRRDGTQVLWIVTFLVVGHSDECYHWTPPTKRTRRWTHR
jgi:hypothetical protein